jgi:hypothetical protein
MRIPPRLPVQTSRVHSPQITTQLAQRKPLPISIVTAVDNSTAIRILNSLGETLAIAKIFGKFQERDFVIRG